jgi:dienelactone hydrolase
MNFPISLLIVAVFAAVCAAAEPVIQQEDFSFTSAFDGTGPLKATVVFQRAAKNHPMMVVQHGYEGARHQVLFSARRMAARGYFCVCISTRGWDGSAGRHDDGGIEIMDIYDGIRAAAKKYSGKADGSRVSIIGYSHGGGNAFLATVRFPYTFRAGMALFGVADYGMWTRLQSSYRATVAEAVGGTPEAVPGKYAARNASLAAGNLSGTRFHIAYDEAETLCPIPMNDAFVAAARKAGSRDVFVHVSRKTDKHRWTHGYNYGHLSPIEDVLMDDIEKHSPPSPVMPPAGELTVIGFVVTPRFRCVLGNGDDAAARLRYDLRNGTAKFHFTPLTRNKQVSAKVTLPDGADCDVEIIVDGRKVDVIRKGAELMAEATIESTLGFREEK